MRKLKRRKVLRSWIESRIEKNQKKIKALSELNYGYRLQLEALDALPKQTPLTKADLEAREKAKEDAENTSPGGTI